MIAKVLLTGLGACVISAQAVSTVRLTHDNAEAHTTVDASGPAVLPPSSFAADYSGLFYTGPGSAVDSDLDVEVSFLVAGSSVVDSAPYNALANIFHRPTDNTITGIASLVADPSGPVLNGTWAGHSAVSLNLEFILEGDPLEIRLEAENLALGFVGYSLLDLTSATVLADVDIINFGEEGEVHSLIPGHRYSLQGYARVEDDGLGDPDSQFRFHFNDATIVPTPEGGSTLACLGMGVMLLGAFKKLRRAV